VEPRKSPKRLIIDIPEDIHQLIKKKAVERNITMRRYVLQALQIRIKQEEMI